MTRRGIAGRLAGAFRNTGRLKVADDIVKTMERAGYTIRETDPFEEARQITLSTRDESPYVTRIRLMWDAMREPVIGALPAAPGIPRNARGYLKAVDDIYVNDAYHSLSIEGYRVSPELIERVRSGAWNPEQNPRDREDRNALAARGYPSCSSSWRASRSRPFASSSGISSSYTSIPYLDGNGRMGRFLMNVMLASGGYPWTIIPLERRNGYMAALESASVRQDIRPFAAFVGRLVEAGIRGQKPPPVPAGA